MGESGAEQVRKAEMIVGIFRFVVKLRKNREARSVES